MRSAKIFAVLAAILLLSILVPMVHAATPLPAPPVTGWCFDSFTAPNYNGVRGCDVTPPPAGTLVRANVSYIGHGAVETATNVDMTSWQMVYGRIDVTDGHGHALPPQVWPGAQGATPQFTLPNGQQICMAFATPANPGTAAHVYTPSGYNTAGGVSIGISQTCGFIPANGCGKNNLGPFSQGMIYRPGATTDYFCGIAPSTAYIVTIKWTTGRGIEADPSHPLCTTAGCKLALQHN